MNSSSGSTSTAGNRHTAGDQSSRTELGGRVVGLHSLHRGAAAAALEGSGRWRITSVTRNERDAGTPPWPLDSPASSSRAAPTRPAAVRFHRTRASSPSRSARHAHGRIDPSIVRSRDGVRVVAWSLLVLAATAALQAALFAASSSVALLADLVHNIGDALTAVPLAIAFLLRSRRGERWAGYAVVATIFVSACVAAGEAIDRLIHPQSLDRLTVLALAGVVGFAGNEVAAQIRLRAGARLDSPALTADGHHTASTDSCPSASSRQRLQSGSGSIGPIRSSRWRSPP